MLNATPRAFLSFDFDNDEKTKLYFAGQGTKDSPTPYIIADWSSKSSLPQSQWESIVAAKIAKCHLLIVLVGKHMSTATGVAKEIAFARAVNVPVFGVYVNGAVPGCTLPSGLPASRVVGWKWADISYILKQAMREGKNA